MMNIGSKIKQLRLTNGYTQEDLADAAGTKKQTIHKYETGIITNIPASKIKAIADKLNTTPAYLMGWEDKKENCHSLDQKPSTNTLSSDEQQLVDDYRKLPLKGKEYLLTTLQFAKQQYGVTDTETEEVAVLQLSEKEKELIKQIRGFDEHIRNDLLKYIADLYRDRDEIPKPNSNMEEKAN